MNKNDLINQYYNKAIEEMEMAETHADKCKCCIYIAEFIAKHVENIEDDMLQIGKQVQSISTENNKVDSNKQNIIQMVTDEQANFKFSNAGKTYIFPVNAEGIPYIPDSYQNDSNVIAAFNTMKMKSANYRKLVEKNIKTNAENILKEDQNGQEQISNNTQQQQNTNNTNDGYSDKDINDYIGYLQEIYEYSTNPQSLDEYVQMYSEGQYTSLSQIQTPENKEILKMFVIFMDANLNEAKEYIENYKNTKDGIENLNEIVANAFGNEQCTADNSLNDSNIIEFAEYLKNIVAWGIFDDYVNSGSISADNLNKIIKTALNDQNADINSVDLDNVRQIVDYLQQKIKK